MYDLKALQQAADKACNMAFNAKHTFHDAAVNWGDLRCTDVQYCMTLGNIIVYRVIIEEASPENLELQRFIEEELANMGFPDVEVVTEW